MIDCLYDCFKHWTANGSLFILSDPHFCDEDCKKMDKNWIDPDEHVAIINKTAHKNDTLLLLGDLGDPEYVKKIKAKIVLVTGNHDKPGDYRDIVSELYDGALMIAPNILVSHEPVENILWAINIHGHDHAGAERWTDSTGGKHVNVASNVRRWVPLNLGKEIKNGLISKIPNIHRITIDHATKNSIKKKNREARKNGEPEIKMPERKPKKVKQAPPQPSTLTVEEKIEKRERKMCDSYCANCHNRTVALDSDGFYVNGGCEKFREPNVVILNKNSTGGIRKVFTPVMPYNEKATKEYFYADNEKMDGDKFVFCAYCPEMMGTIVSAATKAEKEKKDG